VPEISARIIRIIAYGFDVFSPIVLPVILENINAMPARVRIKIMPAIFAMSSCVFGFLISNGRLTGFPFSILKILR